MMARGSNGEEVSPLSPFATCYCLLGGACKVSGSNVSSSLHEPVVKALRSSLGQLMGEESYSVIPDINDGYDSLTTGETGHPAVLRVIDKAIENANAR